MPTTRRQAAAQHDSNEIQESPTKATAKPPSKRATKPRSKAKDAKQWSPKIPAKETSPAAGEKRDATAVKEDDGGGEPHPEEHPSKRVKTENEAEARTQDHAQDSHEKGEKRTQPVETSYQTGTIERGHIYFFYRPKVEHDEAHSLDDVQRFYMLLVPRPPKFATSESDSSGAKTEEDSDMNLLEPGADAVPAAEPTGKTEKRFRLLHIGKKSLPDPDAVGGGKGGGRKQIFWAMVGSVGNDLKKLEDGLGYKEYETKTRGTRHQASARLAARGAYAIVNAEASTPSKRETHLGYHLSHPTPDAFGDVQRTLGIHPASSFVLQVKNPLAPATGGAQVGLSKGRRADFPEEIMTGVFGRGGTRGRESYGLRFASVERGEMLDYEGAELLFIAARSGEEGLEASLGEGRGAALEAVEKAEGEMSIETVMKELAMDTENIPADPLEGEWA